MVDRGPLLTYGSRNNRVLNTSILDLTSRYYMSCVGNPGCHPMLVCSLVRLDDAL